MHQPWNSVGFFLLSFFPSSVSMQPQHCIGDQRTRSLHGYCYCPLFPSDVKPRQAKRLRNSLSVCNMQKKIRRRGKNIEGLQNMQTPLGAFQTTGQYTGQMSLAHARTSHRLHMSHSAAPVWPHAAGHHRLDRQGWGALNTTL